MKILIFVVCFLVTLQASEYYAKAQPKEFFSLKSSVSGEVVISKESAEGKVSDGSVVVKIDDAIDSADLTSSKLKLQYLQNNISLMQESVKNAKKAAMINRDNYNRVKELSSYSKVQKDAKLLSMINAQNSYISAKTSLENLKTQKEDIKLKIKILKDKIEKKNIKVKSGNYIYKIYPRKGDYLNPGSKLMDVYDISLAKLVIFVPADELNGIESKKIYLDGRVSDAKVYKIWDIADSVNISSYRVEILIPKPERFSKLVKVEFK